MSGQIGGDFGPITIPDKAEVEIGQFTVERAGEYQMTVELTEIVKDPTYPDLSVVNVEISIDGERYLISQADPEVVTTSADLAVGQEVTIVLDVVAIGVTVSGSWLVESDALIPLPPNAFFPSQIECVHWGVTKAQALYYGGILIWQDEEEPEEPTEPQLWNLTTQGDHIIEVPVWAAVIDIVCLGGGGGGGAGEGSVANAGYAGGAGDWGLLRVSADDLPSRTLRATVGQGGSGGQSAGQNGAGGLESVVRDDATSQQIGWRGIGGSGGRGGGAGGNNGGSPGTRTFEGRVYQGGAGGAYRDSRQGGNGSPPGGGGGPGGGGFFGNYWRGGSGARGAIWITAWSQRALDQ